MNTNQLRSGKFYRWGRILLAIVILCAWMPLAGQQGRAGAAGFPIRDNSSDFLKTTKMPEKGVDPLEMAIAERHSGSDVRPMPEVASEGAVFAWDDRFGLPGVGGIDYAGVNAVALDGQGNLYAGGYFTTAGGGSANHVARWDGEAWHALGSGMEYV